MWCWWNTGLLVAFLHQWQNKSSQAKTAKALPRKVSFYQRSRLTKITQQRQNWVQVMWVGSYILQQASLLTLLQRALMQHFLVRRPHRQGGSGFIVAGIWGEPVFPYFWTVRASVKGEISNSGSFPHRFESWFSPSSVLADRWVIDACPLCHEYAWVWECHASLSALLQSKHTWIGFTSFYKCFLIVLGHSSNTI